MMATGTGYRQMRNGNTRPEPEPWVSTTRPLWMQLPGMTRILESEHIPSATNNQTPGVCMTCSATFKNGFRTGTTVLINLVPKLPILRDLRIRCWRYGEWIGPFAAAPG